MNSNFIFNGDPDPESYAQRQTINEKEKQMKKLHKQENIQNQFIAFKKVHKGTKDVEKRLKTLLKQEKDKNQIELLTTQQQFYEKMNTVQK